jgi:hypothetical protein
VKHCIAIALFVLGLTGCKQGVGERCQVNTDCASNHCSMSDPQVCVTAEGNNSGDIDATIPDPAGITAFSFLKANNPGLASDVTAMIPKIGTITAELPVGAARTVLVATFDTPGVSIAVAGTAQVNGITPNDFTNPIVYRVTFAEGSTQDYTVTVTP